MIAAWRLLVNFVMRSTAATSQAWSAGAVRAMEEMLSSNLMNLPGDLPVPMDDGAADHLRGFRLPSITLSSTSGRQVRLDALQSPTVIFAYPRTGAADSPVPDGWDLIPGARGCTPETCGFRDHYSEFRALGFSVFGLSTQDTQYQQEMVERLGVPFEILSDHEFALTEVLNLPTFEFEGVRLLKRLTLIIGDGVVQHVFYPVFPPNSHADKVIEWLHNHPIGGSPQSVTA